MVKPERFRPPPGNALIILLAAVAGVIAVGAVVAAVVFAAKVNALSDEVQDLAGQQQRGRRAAIRAICVTDTAQNRALRSMIVNGAKGSRIFEPIYRQYGAPSYNQRVREAREAAGKLPDVNCARLQRRARTGS